MKSNAKGRTVKEAGSLLMQEGLWVVLSAVRKTDKVVTTARCTKRLAEWLARPTLINH